MSKMIVMGAGIVGRAAAWDLARRGHDVTVADADPIAAERVGLELGIDHTVADGGDPATLVGLFDGSDAVVSAIPYGFGPVVASASIETGCHYLDFGGNPTVVAEQLLLDEQARTAGVAVVPDCGLAPGVAGVLAIAAAEQLGDGPIEMLALRVGALPVEPKGTLEYQLAFSPGGLVNEYAEPCEVLRDGEYATREPLTGFEDVEWPGWGPLEAFHTAGGSSSLPRIYEGRVQHLDYKTLRYPGHGRIFRAMLELGLFDEQPMPVGNTDIAPRAVLLAALAEHLPTDEPDVVLVRTWVRAVRDGETRTAGYQIVDLHDGRFSALARTTAFPATALAHLLVTGKVDTIGAATMDASVDAADLIPEMVPTGVLVEDWAPRA